MFKWKIFINRKLSISNIIFLYKKNLLLFKKLLLYYLWFEKWNLTRNTAQP